MIALLAACLDAAAGQQAPANPAPAQADPFKFSTDAAAMLFTVKADEVESFESVWSVIRSRLAASTNPSLRELGQHLQMFRVAGLPPTSKEATYVFVADPVSKESSYGVSPFLLYDSGLFERPEAEELFKLMQPAIVSISSYPLQAIVIK